MCKNYVVKKWHCLMVKSSIVFISFVRFVWYYFKLWRNLVHNKDKSCKLMWGLFFGSTSTTGSSAFKFWVVCYLWWHCFPERYELTLEWVKCYNPLLSNPNWKKFWNILFWRHFSFGIDLLIVEKIVVQLVHNMAVHTPHMCTFFPFASHRHIL